MRIKKLSLFAALLLAALALSGCGAAAGGGVNAVPWPSRDPAATPYIQRVIPEAPESSEGESYASWTDMLRSLYEEVNSFFFVAEDLEAFCALPPQEEYSFSVHLEPGEDGDERLTGLDSPEKMSSVRAELDREYSIIAAQAFSAQGCEARVKGCATTTDGTTELTNYICVVTMTPEKMFELSEVMEELYFIEPLYPKVDARHDILVWPEGGEGT